jgi:hypothetical protein
VSTAWPTCLLLWHDSLTICFFLQGASVHNGASTTLVRLLVTIYEFNSLGLIQNFHFKQREIGFVDYLKAGEHGWDNLHAKVLAEQDMGKQAQLRRQASLAEYYLSSACAISEQGDIVVVDLTGTRVGTLFYVDSTIT